MPCRHFQLRTRHWAGGAGALLLAAGAVLAQAPPGPAEPTRREFSMDAPRSQPFRWTSQPVTDGERTIREGLAYTWSLPADFDDSRAFDLLIVCHPVGQDAAWAHRALNVAQLGSRIIIAPDGTSAIAKGVRSFRADDNDFLAFREFVLEITRTFPGDRIFLYGYEQGAGFALGFAGLFPSLSEGVVIQGGAPWENTPMKGGVQQVPLVFLQGTTDEKLPGLRVAAARDAYAEHGHSLLWLRPLHEHGHDPHSAAAAQAIDWCAGMVSLRPEDVLAAAVRLLDPAPFRSDRSVSPAFGPASQVLRRLLGESENNPAHEPLEEVPPEVRARARALLERIDAHAAVHIAAVRAEAPAESDLVLNGKPWLGRLMALREDFRGVHAVEQFALKSGYDHLVRRHARRSDELLAAAQLQDPKQRFELVMDLLPETFTLEGFTPALVAQLKTDYQRAAALKLSEESLERYENATLLEAARREGLAQYQQTLREWTSGAK